MPEVKRKREKEGAREKKAKSSLEKIAACLTSDTKVFSFITRNMFEGGIAEMNNADRQQD